MPTTSAPSADRLVGDRSRGLKFAEILDLHLRLAQHSRDGDDAVLVLVDAHDRERDEFTRHGGLPRSRCGNG